MSVCRAIFHIGCNLDIQIGPGSTRGSDAGVGHTVEEMESGAGASAERGEFRFVHPVWIDRR